MIRPGVMILFIMPLIAAGQNNLQNDSVGINKIKKLDIFPAISYSPETKLTLGVIGITYFNLSGKNQSTPVSNVEFIGIYSLNRQIILETRWDVFSSRNRWRSRGEAFFNRYPDRNYGLGNRAETLVLQADGQGNRDTFNYLLFNSDRLKLSPVALRFLSSSLYIGLQYDMEYVYRMQIRELQSFINSDSALIQDLDVAGLRSGIGFQLLFDTRKPLLNPLKGTSIELNNLHYAKFLGSDYQFSLISVDARKFINTLKNQTLALRVLGAMEFTNDKIPMRALSRIGGPKFIRGYFKGTYQDRHMLAFESEYRLPFWPEGNNTNFWRVWKRLGVVGFLSGGQVFHSLSEFSLDRFNLAIGGGLRILFNAQSRVNLRIDYAVGLRNDSGGPGKRQNGLYFFLGEAF